MSTISASISGDAQSALAAMPKYVQAAHRSASKKIKTVVDRSIARAVAVELGTTQKAVKGLGRVRTHALGEGGLVLWIGTNEVQVHRLGKPRWKRTARGATVNRAMYPRSWSWGAGSATSEAVMERIGQRRTMSKGRYQGQIREAIDVVSLDIDAAVRRRVIPMADDLGERFRKTLLHEMKFYFRKGASA